MTTYYRKQKKIWYVFIDPRRYAKRCHSMSSVCLWRSGTVITYVETLRK